MAIVANDILQIEDHQTYLGQQVLNVYHYRVESFESAASYEDFADQWQVLVMSDIINIQVTNVVHARTVVRNLTNGIDIYEQVISTTGTVSGDGLPSLVAASFRLVRTDATTRHGAKRIAGLAESQIAYNDPISAAVAAFNNVAASMGDVVEQTGTVDHDFLLQPVIVGRTETAPGSGMYELDLTKINLVQSAQFIRISSQTTRRAGRGA